jgi:hypothetical protein
MVINEAPMIVESSVDMRRLRQSDAIVQYNLQPAMLGIGSS